MFPFCTHENIEQKTKKKKHQCWSLFLKSLLKGDFNTDFLLWILQNV